MRNNHELSGSLGCTSFKLKHIIISEQFSQNDNSWKDYKLTELFPLLNLNINELFRQNDNSLHKVWKYKNIFYKYIPGPLYQ